MPIYEYRCTSCGYSFEKIQKFSDTPESECPKCHGKLIRPVTAPALRFEGAGWYVNDYAGKGAAKSEPTAAPAAESTPAAPAKTDSAPAAAPAASPAATTPAAGS